MPNDAERHRHALVLAMRAAALTLAGTAVDLAECDSLDGNDLRLITDLRALLDDVEVAMVSLARSDDVTWQQISHALEVTRQSAHRRLNKQVDSATKGAYDVASDRAKRSNAEAIAKNGANYTLRGVRAVLRKIEGTEVAATPGRRGDRPGPARSAAP